jgi:hypothetical protein
MRPWVLVGIAVLMAAPAAAEVKSATAPGGK